MNKIENLIKELCPEGVPMVKIKDAYKRLKGTPITAGVMKEIEDENGDTLIFAGGKTIVRAFESKILKANVIRVPSVVVQSRGVIDFQYCDSPFTFKNEMWAYTHETSHCTKYLYYYLKTKVEQLRVKGSEHGSMPQISLAATEDLEIPLPPLDVQKEIVRILDKFSAMVENLDKELELRQKQYEYYREKLLTFEEGECEWKKLGDYCKIFDGTHQTPKYKDEGIKFVSVENIEDLYKSDKYISIEDYNKQYNNKPKNGDVLMTRIGSVGKCAIVSREEPLAFYVSLALLRPNKYLQNKYLRFYLESSIGAIELRKHTLIHAVPLKINKGDIGKVSIPVPPLPRQQEIVDTLDKFEAMIANLKGERALRQKQYEYYREKLLTFN